MSSEWSLDALTIVGVLLIVLLVGVFVYLCNRPGAACSDNSPPGGGGGRVG